MSLGSLRWSEDVKIGHLTNDDLWWRPSIRTTAEVDDLA